jgi:hypothetical protein
MCGNTHLRGKTVSTKHREFRALKGGATAVLSIMIFQIIASLSERHFIRPATIGMGSRGNASMRTTSTGATSSTSHNLFRGGRKVGKGRREEGKKKRRREEGKKGRREEGKSVKNKMECVE